jgi:hypothetical protein
MPYPILGTPKPAFFDSSGSPLVSGTLTIVEPSDDTNKATYPTYDDAVALTNANANPLTLDGRGEPANELWGLDGEDYKITLKDSTGANVWSVDDVRVPIILPYLQTAAEVAAGVTPTNVEYEPYDIRRYGAVADGDGVGGGTDNTTAIQNALTAAPSGEIVNLPPGIYRMDSPISLTDKSINIDGYGATLDFSNNTTVDAVAVTIQGSETTTTTTTTADIVQGATALTVVSGSIFSDDEWISIESSSELLANEATFLKGELARVSSTAATTINIYGGTKDSYDKDASTVTITQFSMIDKPSIRGIKIIGSGDTSHDHVGIQISYAVSPLIRDVSVIDCAGTGMDFNRCTHGLMQGCFVDNANDSGSPSTGYSYSFSPFTQHSTVDSCRSMRFKHCFTTGGLLPVWNWQVTNCNFSYQIEQSTGMLTTHHNAVNGVVSGCSLDNGHAGLNLRGPRNTVTGNVITNMTGSFSIHLVDDGPIDSVISGNRCEGIQGIRSDAVTANTGSTVISNNIVTGLAAAGGTISTGIVAKGPHASIIGNTVNNHSLGIGVEDDDSVVMGNSIFETHNATAGFAIRVVSGTANTVQDNTIRNLVSSTCTNGILVDAAATDTRIINNDIADTSGPTISDSGTGTYQFGNTLDGVMQLAQKNELPSTTNVITQAENGKTFFLSNAAGFTSTLPVPLLGLKFRFIVRTIPSSGDYVITTDSGDNILFGTINEITTTAGVAISAQDTLNFKSGVAQDGDWAEFESDGLAWYVHGAVQTDNAVTVSVT